MLEEYKIQVWQRKTGEYMVAITPPVNFNTKKKAKKYAKRIIQQLEEG